VGATVAESIIVHFASANWSDIACQLDRLAARSSRDYGGGACWQAPNSGDYMVLLYEYADHVAEFEADQLRRLHELLGGPPSSAACLELRRSSGRAAYDVATALATELLREFAGLVQDIGGDEYWSLADLESGVADQAARLWWPDAEPDV
jgi:hypothetical protein